MPIKITSAYGWEVFFTDLCVQCGQGFLEYCHKIEEHLIKAIKQDVII